VPSLSFARSPDQFRPCQKSPSQKTTTRTVLKTISGLPGRVLTFLRYRSPIRHNLRRKINSCFVSRLRLARLARELAVDAGKRPSKDGTLLVIRFMLFRLMYSQSRYSPRIIHTIPQHRTGWPAIGPTSSPQRTAYRLPVFAAVSMTRIIQLHLSHRQRQIHSIPFLIQPNLTRACWDAFTPKISIAVESEGLAVGA
jgi:hypothetical protein